MDEEPEICQTCLSSDRFLYRIADLKDCLINLQIKLNSKIGAGVCWECKRLFEKFSSFKAQVLKAQKLLNSNEKAKNLKSLSALSKREKYYHDSCLDPITNIHITCTEAGPILVKQEVTESTIDETQDTSNGPNSRNCVDVENTKSNENSTENREIENISELPRITLVESITENSNETSKPTQSGTEIELNIPVAKPIRTREDGTNIPTGSKLRKLLTVQRNDKKRTEHVEPNAVAKSKNVIEVNNEAASNAESIMVKVVYKECETEVHGIRIKEEPISDAEDMVDDPITLHHAEEARVSTVTNADASVSVSISEVKQEPSSVEELQHRLWKKSILLVYSRIRAHKYASRFLRPITDAIAPEYSQVVRRPMDLGTIRANIKAGHIRSTAEFQRDILLMLSNALMYNSSDHFVYSMAKDLLEEVKYQLSLLETVHSLPYTAPVTRPRRRLDTELQSPPAKRPRMSAVETKARKITPKRERKSVEAKVIPKKISPKQERKSTVTKVKPKKITPKMERKSIAKPAPNRRKSASAKVAQKIKAERKSVACSAFKTSAANVEGRRKSTRVSCKIKRYTPTLQPNPIAITKVNKKQQTSSQSSGDTYMEVTPVTEKKRRGRKPNSKPEPIYMDDGFTGSETDTDDFCVAITTEPQRDLSRDEASYLKKILEDKILSIALDCSEFAPRFRGKPIIADGVIKLWCDDQKSLVWLIKTISKLPKKIGRFVVRKQTDLPKKIKSAIVVPGFNGEMEVILRVLKAQNPWAQVESWAVYSAEQRGESVILVLGIPSTAIPTLLSRQRRLAYSLGSVYVKFYNVGNKLSDLPPEQRLD